VADARRSIRRRQRCAFRVNAECGPLFLHSSYRHQSPVRSALPDPINASPTACSFTNLKTGPTKAKNSLASQLPPWPPVRLSRPHAAGPEGVMGLSRVRSRVRRAYPGYGCGRGTPAPAYTQHDCPLLAKPWHCDCSPLPRSRGASHRPEGSGRAQFGAFAARRTFASQRCPALRLPRTTRLPAWRPLRIRVRADAPILSTTFARTAAR
jgi:hypothetical protein